MTTNEQNTPAMADDAVVSKKDKMEKLQYPADREFEKIIDDYLSMDAILDHHKTNSGLLLCSNKMEAIADSSRKILYGYDSFKVLQDEAISTDTTTKASAFRWKTEAEDREVLSDLREKQRQATAYGEKDVHVRKVTEDENDVEVDLEYTIEKRGKLQGLAKYRKSTSFIIENFDSEEESTVYHEYDKVNQETAIREFIEGWNEERVKRDKEGVETKAISISNLSLSSRVKFIRELMGVETENWTRKNVEGVEVQRDKTILSEDEAEELDAELEGIRNAALSGQRLDTNNFVQKCEDNGFYLTKVEIRYEHKDVARRAIIEIDFKEKRRETFEVSINKQLKQKESGWVGDDFSASFREEIRREFREIVIEKYDEYMDADEDLKLD